MTTAKERFSYRWLIGADGQNSQVRKWAGLDPRVARRKRFGFCSHFQVRPWSDVAEVHWARGCQIFITPMAGQEIGVAVISRDPALRVEKALARFPVLAEKLRGATPTTREMGDTTGLRILPAVTRGRVALVGDASGTVDAVTGHGLSLSFQQAIPLAEAMRRGRSGPLSARAQEISQPCPSPCRASCFSWPEVIGFAAGPFACSRKRRACSQDCWRFMRRRCRFLRLAWLKSRASAGNFSGPNAHDSQNPFPSSILASVPPRGCSRDRSR